MLQNYWGKILSPYLTGDRFGGRFARLEQLQEAQ